MSRTGTTNGSTGTRTITLVIFHRGVGSPWVAGARSHGTGQHASRDPVLGAKRDRLSSRFGKVAQASMAKISTKGSTGVPPKLSHNPSGNVRIVSLPGYFKKGCGVDTESFAGRPRNQASSPPGRGAMPGGC